MRATQTLLPTLKEVPAEAEVPSHRLLLRAGFIRKVASGIYSYLPMGQRVLAKAAAIVREEMERSGALEVLLPVLQPTELWKESGRLAAYQAERLMFTLKDRKDAEMCLGPTHEEVVTELVRRDVRSYRQLPLNLFQIQTKFRDELRPRFGLLRAREFLMKDAYSFDRDEASLEHSFRTMVETYHRIFARMGIRPLVVEADVGAIGGSASAEFMVPSPTGEDSLASCAACGYGANLERAEAGEDVAPAPAAPLPLSTVGTVGKRSVEEVSAFLSRKPHDFIKTLVYVADGQPVVVLSRGDREVNETKLKNLLQCLDLALARDEVVERVTGAPVGFAGPVRLHGVRVLADRAVADLRNAVTGANAADQHHVDVNPGRDFPLPELADLRLVREADPCPRCGKPLSVSRGLEVGHVFKLGTTYSAKMRATFSAEDGSERPFMMGCYGIGVSRCVAAAVEQSHDERGIIWPISLSPYSVLVLATNPDDDAVRREAEHLYDALRAYGIEVLYDDRTGVSAGAKFKDADLVGIPLVAVVGQKGLKEGVIEVRRRAGGPGEKVHVAQAAAAMRDLYLSEKARLRENA